MNHLATLQCHTTSRAKPQRVLENPVTGERITFVTRSDETEGRLHQHRLELPPGSSLARQLHPYQQKCLKVTSGKLRVWLNELEHLLGPNDDLVILAGTAHIWRNDSDTEVSVIVTMRPALRSEELLRAQVALAKEKKTNKALRYAALAHTFKNEIVFIQHPLRQALQPIFAVLSNILGYKTFYKHPALGESYELPTKRSRHITN